MRKLILLFLTGIILALPQFASAQNEVHLAGLNVQLWPEYDQPSMLVIHDFVAAEDTQFPVNLTFRFPAEANLIAVAVTENGNMINTPFEGPTTSGDWQTITIAVQNTAVYRFEYYEAMTLTGNQRLFTYLWDGAYAVDAFSLRVQEPADVVSLLGEPSLTKTVDESGTVFHNSKINPLNAGQTFTQKLTYDKTSKRLIVEALSVQTKPIDNTTTGRPASTKYLPYALIFFGVLLLAGSIVYYFQNNKAQTSTHRKRHTQSNETSADIHCHQCGARAKEGDRFCRTCGTKLRLLDE